MTAFNDGDKAVEIRRIIDEALSEALSEITLKSYREIWVDMFGKIMSIQNPETASDWKRENSKLQDEVGEEFGFPFSQFIKDVARIESSVLKVLAENGQELTLN